MTVILTTTSSNDLLGSRTRSEVDEGDVRGKVSGEAVRGGNVVGVRSDRLLLGSFGNWGNLSRESASGYSRRSDKRSKDRAAESLRNISTPRDFLKTTSMQSISALEKGSRYFIAVCTLISTRLLTWRHLAACMTVRLAGERSLSRLPKSKRLNFPLAHGFTEPNPTVSGGGRYAVEEPGLLRSSASVRIIDCMDVATAWWGAAAPYISVIHLS